MGKKYWGFGVVVLVVAVWLATGVSGDPSAPLSLDVGASFRANFTATGNNHEAQAGNVTELNINGISVTDSWQGYYGNVTGKLTLQDANNNTFYDWLTISNEGEVYATLNETINWSSVHCLNFSADGTSNLNLSIVEQMFGIDDLDVDGFNETFNQTFAGEFFIGSRKINGSSGCAKTNLFDDGGAQTVSFEEVLLEDRSIDGLIFASIVDNDVTGFDGRTWDFQMLVAEDGHSGNTQTTTYYFYTEMV